MISIGQDYFVPAIGGVRDCQATTLPYDQLQLKRLSHTNDRGPETLFFKRDRVDQTRKDTPNRSEYCSNARLHTKERIYRQYLHGESADALASSFRRTKRSIDEIIAEMRATRIMALPLKYVPSDEFLRVRSKKSEQIVLGPMPEAEIPMKKPRLPSHPSAYLAGLYEVPLLTPRQEVHLFRKMNYLKYKASRLRTKLDMARPKRQLMNQIERLYEEAVATRNHIIRANLRLVVSIARQYVRPGQDFFEMVSDGNVSLMRAVDRFDHSRGYKFSTYASWAIMTNFRRTVPHQHRNQRRFPTGHAGLCAAAEDRRSDPFEKETAQAHRQAQVQQMLRQLNDRERQVIVRRFGLCPGDEPLTLKQVGVELGVTKERIRQIEGRALGKLREAAEHERVEIVE